MSGQDGKVTFAGYNGDYGYVVVVSNDNGLVSKYAHCDTLKVSVGDEIMAGDIIATVGNTGASTGPHVHIEIIRTSPVAQIKDLERVPENLETSL